MSELEKQSNEQKILVAAEQEFLTKGFDGARTTSIAKAAGVTHAMLHYYFRTKEQLFERILDEKVSVMSKVLFPAWGDPDLPFLNRLTMIISAHFDFLVENPLLPRFLINEILSRPERYELLQSRISQYAGVVFDNLQTEITKSVEKGEILPVDGKMLFINVMSLNVFTFIAYPLLETAMGDLMADRERFLAARKAENIEVIMSRILKR